MTTIPAAIEVVTLFCDDIARTKQFYRSIFDAEVVYEDAVSAVLAFSGAMVNLLASTEAPTLVAPGPVGLPGAGARMLLTIRVADVDAAVAAIEAKGVRLLNGPIDRPWGRRTAAFADPSGHIWEFAAPLR